MAQFNVTWEIQLTAKNAIEAACMAYAIQRDPDSLADHFDVSGEDGSETAVNVSEHPKVLQKVTWTKVDSRG